MLRRNEASPDLIFKDDPSALKVARVVHESECHIAVAALCVTASFESYNG